MREILHKIREADMYAIIGDEESDVSLKVQLCICIHWVDNNFNIYEVSLELMNVSKTDSNRITALIKDRLVRFALPLVQCREQAYDGASNNMSRHINGVATQIQKEEPSALYVYCLAHSTNLCL